MEDLVDTNDEWIVKRTGIKERREAAGNEFTGDLCIAAVSDMTARYRSELSDVDMVIVCTHTPDMPAPPTAARVQSHFGIGSAGAMDLNATCAGFVYGLQTAHAMIAAGVHRKVLVAAGDTMTKVTDYRDRSTCILFGDGAGAVLVERDEAGETAVLASHSTSDGSGGHHVYRTGLSSTLNGAELSPTGLLVQNGREVYKWAVSSVPEGMKELVRKGGMNLDQVDWFIPHSANLRMIESICEKSGMPMEKTLQSVVRYGNTSAASIPLALDIGVKEGKIKPGDTLLLYGFGSGLVQSGMLLHWSV